MKELFYRGEWQFMTTLTILLVITTVWIICHFIIAYTSKQTNQEKYLRRIGYVKTMGLFTMLFGICGQMMGFYDLFQIIEERTKLELELTPEMIMHSIKMTLIVTIYGILIYLISLMFIASTLIKNKVESLNST
ncbi:MAG: hypothetical protein COB60_12515 [Flavobacteriaceae bacterium]|nr:MAG: hypothetical protein COB60_12515 [Flavobacteriaceae bacterium]